MSTPPTHFARRCVVPLAASGMEKKRHPANPVAGLSLRLL
jgi:hypothetical protein